MNKIDLELLKELTEMYGPTGEEDGVRAFIRKQIAPFVHRMWIDPMGNLVATVGQSEILYAAHMDEVGFMITGIEEDGALRFSQVGGVTPKTLPGKRVLIGKGAVPGVISAVPFHLQDDSKKEIGYGDLTITIGAKSKKDAEKIVSPGDCAVFNTRFRTVGKNGRMLAGKAMDNRLGCYLLIEMIRSGTNGVYAFTVQEETGLRGAYAVAEEVPFRFGVALDTTTPADVPGVTGPDRVCQVGKGGVLSFLDGASVYDNRLISELFEAVETEEVPVQTKTRKSGGNDASALQKAGSGHRSVSLSTPGRYIHGPCALVSTDDVYAMANALSVIHRFLTERAKAERSAL